MAVAAARQRRCPRRSRIRCTDHPFCNGEPCKTYRTRARAVAAMAAAAVPAAQGAVSGHMTSSCQPPGVGFRGRGFSRSQQLPLPHRPWGQRKRRSWSIARRCSVPLGTTRRRGHLLPGRRRSAGSHYSERLCSDAPVRTMSGTRSCCRRGRMSRPCIRGSCARSTSHCSQRYIDQD